MMWRSFMPLVIVAAGCASRGAPRSAAVTGRPATATPRESATPPVPVTRDRDPKHEKKKMARSLKESARARRSLRAGQVNEAVSQAQAALMIHEQNVDAMLVLAEVFYKQGKFELTHAVVGSALSVDEKTRIPKDTARAYNLKGFAHIAMGQKQAATNAFKKAAESDDQNAGAWNNLGTRYLDAGDTQTATSCFQYAIDLRPDFAKAHLNLGAAHRAQRQWIPAERSLLKALALRPNYPQAYFDLGVLYLDADPFPNLDTLKRLEKTIVNLTRYRDLAATAPPAQGGTEARLENSPRDGGGHKDASRPSPIGPRRAEDYIEVAKKAVEREQRRIDREKKRATGQSTPRAREAAPTESERGDGAQPNPPPAEPEARRSEPNRRDRDGGRRSV